MNKEKTSLKDIFVYLLMVLIGFMMVLPPLLRIVLKEEKQETPQLEKVTALVCRRQELVGNMTYNITITSNYKKNELDKIIFNYEQVPNTDLTVPSTEQIPSNVEPTLPSTESNLGEENDLESPIVSSSVEQEIQALRSSSFITETSSDTSNRFILEKESIINYATDPIVLKYNNSINIQRSTLSQQDYTCQEITT